MVRVQLEFNPFTLESRFERARVKGHIGKALRLCVDEGSQKLIVHCLKEDLPDWPVRKVLLDAAPSLMNLRRDLVTPPCDRYVDRSLGQEFTDYVGNALNELCGMAERTLAAGILAGASGRPPVNLQRATDRLMEFIGFVDRVRGELTELVTAGETGVKRVRQDLQTMVSMARAAREAMEAMG